MREVAHNAPEVENAEGQMKKIVMVEPITKKPTSFEPPPHVPLIFTGHYQNVAYIEQEASHE